MIRYCVILSLSLLLEAASYNNCDFKNPRYEAVCQEAVKKGATYQYANEFLLSWRVGKRDQKSFDLFQPKEFSAHHANEKRANNDMVKYIPRIVEHIKKYEKVYKLAESRYNVDREVIAAILMKETRLGTYVPKHEAFTVFNTLLLQVKEDTSRNRWLLGMAQENMARIIVYCGAKHIQPEQCRFSSSYAGAVGIPQFMPQNFGYIQGYQSEVGNLDVMEDAILSVAAFLHTEAKYDTLIEWNNIPNMQTLESQWYDYDFTHKNASFVYEKGKNGTYQCFTCNEPKLQKVRHYVQRIMRYNNSSNYAVGVLRLAYDAHKILAP
jgi:membrane-bound lytic murein transglycosylase B